jgi:LysM repeat protein
VSYAGGPSAPATGDPAVASRPYGINATDTSARPYASQDSSGVRFSPTRPSATAGAPTLPSAPSLEPVASQAPVIYTVVGGDSLWAVAKKHGVSVQELTAVNSLSGTTLKPGQTLIIPQSAADSAPAMSAAPAPAAERATYTVRSGDTLGAIARRHSTTVAALKSANRMTSDILRPGQQLILPANSSSSSTVSAAASALPAPTVASPAPARSSGGGMTHTVAPGDTLSEIARRYGVRSSEIATANNVTDPRSLKVGQVLTIPGWQAPAGGATKAAAAPVSTPAPAPAVPTLTPNVPAEENAPTVNLIIPGANPQQTPASEPAGEVPVIRVEDSPSDDGAPRIE